MPSGTVFGMLLKMLLYLVDRLQSVRRGAPREAGGSQRLWSAASTCGAVAAAATPLQLNLIAGVPALPTALLSAASVAFVCLLLFFFDRIIDDVVADAGLTLQVPMIIVPVTTLTLLLLPSTLGLWTTVLVGIATGAVFSVSFLGAVRYLRFALSPYAAVSVSATSLVLSLLMFGLSYWVVALPVWVAAAAGLVTATIVLYVLYRVSRLLPSLGRSQWY